MYKKNLFKFSAQGSDLALFVSNGTKVKIPSEIKPPLLAQGKTLQPKLYLCKFHSNISVLWNQRNAVIRSNEKFYYHNGVKGVLELLSLLMDFFIYGQNCCQFFLADLPT